MNKIVLLISIISLAFVALIGCAGMQVKIGERAQETLIEEAGFEIGLYLGKNYPESRTALLGFAEAMQEAEPADQESKTWELSHYLAKHFNDDAVAVARISRFFTLFEFEPGEAALNPKMRQQIIAGGRGLAQGLDIATKK